MRRTTVTRKAIPQLAPMARNIVLLIKIRGEYSGSEVISSDATKIIIVVAANQRLMSESESGKIIKVNPQFGILFLLLARVVLPWFLIS